MHFGGVGALNSNPAIVYVMVKHNPTPSTAIIQPIVPKNNLISATPQPILLLLLLFHHKQDHLVPRKEFHQECGRIWRQIN
jgi:hypothetical protein